MNTVTSMKDVDVLKSNDTDGDFPERYIMQTICISGTLYRCLKIK